ncbi:hypothetical protein [Rhizobium sp. P28RR-XV]|uniref:hypothetical protein n=1 Tax=Rhizobium sp. P28RR-XV TaxID=2726737 RepID=UPI0014564F88|nr:hypothetical protein [Rhizobium sp. P28RR-XV]NLR88646.1 hypothetical protein [Rhizobium sp. P28RR-XV]
MSNELVISDQSLQVAGDDLRAGVGVGSSISDAPIEALPVEESRSQMLATSEGEKFVYGLERMGGFKTHIQRVQSAVAGMMADLGSERDQRAFMARFDNDLPEPVRYGLYEQIVIGLPTFSTPVSDEDFAKFTAGGEVGRNLAAEWGSMARENIYIIWMRMNYLKARIGNDGMRIFVGWFERLPTRSQSRILKFIATGK